MSMTNKEIFKLANKLSNEDFCALMNIFGDKIEIYLGSLGKRLVSADFGSAGMNGPIIQVNTTMVDLDDIREHDEIKSALLAEENAKAVLDILEDI